MLKQRNMLQAGGNAVTHGGTAGGTGTDNERRDKDKQPSEIELK